MFKQRFASEFVNIDVKIKDVSKFQFKSSFKDQLSEEMYMAIEFDKSGGEMGFSRNNPIGAILRELRNFINSCLGQLISLVDLAFLKDELLEMELSFEEAYDFCIKRINVESLYDVLFDSLNKNWKEIVGVDVRREIKEAAKLKEELFGGEVFVNPLDKMASIKRDKDKELKSTNEKIKWAEIKLEGIENRKKSLLKEISIHEDEFLKRKAEMDKEISSRKEDLHNWEKKSFWSDLKPTDEEVDHLCLEADKLTKGVFRPLLLRAADMTRGKNNEYKTSFLSFHNACSILFCSDNMIKKNAEEAKNIKIKSLEEYHLRMNKRMENEEEYC